MPRVAASKPSNPNPQGQKSQNAQNVIRQVIEPAEVVDIIMDPSHPEWSPDKRRVIGTVMARPLVRQFGQPIDNLQWYQPLNSNVSHPPLLGEIVLLINAPSKSAQLIKEGTSKYYMSIVNIWNYVNHNALPASSYNINAPDENTTQNYRGFTGNSRGGFNDVPFGETFEEKTIPRIFPFEGDIIYEGRWGQSIRFGSTVAGSSTDNSWSSNGDDGDPITIISNGLSTEDSAYHLENINDDASGIWLCDGQSVPIDVASQNADSYAQSFAGAKSAERLSVAGAEGPSTTTDGGASSGGASAANAASSPGSENSTAEDYAATPETTVVEPDAEISEAVEELEEAGEFDAFRNGKFVEKIECVVIDRRIVNKKFADKILTVKQAAQKDGVSIKLNSGFRPMEKASGDGWSTSGQMTLRRQNASTKVGGGKSGLSAAAGEYSDGFSAQKRQSGYFSPLTAGPGYSNHQNGKAFDLSTGMGKSQSAYSTTTKTWRWLVANMHKYGFIRSVKKERWHWEYAPGKGMFSRVPRDHGTWDNLV
jgi:LAS superfamily LD-carboxypeptidase LdcB